MLLHDKKLKLTIVNSRTENSTVVTKAFIPTDLYLLFSRLAHTEHFLLKLKQHRLSTHMNLKNGLVKTETIKDRE